MPLTATGELKLSQIAAEFNDTAPHGMSEFYSAATGIPASGQIGVTDFYGADGPGDGSGGGGGGGGDGGGGGGGGGGGVPLSLSFYESRYGSNIGTIDVYVIDTSGNIQGSSVYSASGNLGYSAWQLRTAATPNVSGSFQIAWHYVSGASFRGDYAIDTVSLQGNTYNFDSTSSSVFSTSQGFGTTSGVNTSNSVTAYQNAVFVPTATSVTLGRWNRDTGTTPSSSTGPSSAHSGTHFLYAETSSSNSSSTGVNMWLFSPIITV
jgi:hypothetical protein